MSKLPKLFPVLWQGWDRNEVRKFKELGCPRNVPWYLVAPHENRAWLNHGQTLKRLSERGGLSPKEMVCLLTDNSLRLCWELTEEGAIRQLLRLIAARERDV